MTASSIKPPFETFRDVDGTPLESGYIYIGTANLSPETNPVSVYWDSSLTIAASQPIRTIGGYPSRNGTPAMLYADGDYSIMVKSRKGTVIYTAPSLTERLPSLVTPGSGAVLESITALRALSKTSYQSAFVLNYYSTSQGGGGEFYYVPTDTTSADNGGTIIVAADGGRWYRVDTGSINPSMFGGVGDGVTVDTVAAQTAVTFGVVDLLGKTWLVDNEITLVSNTVLRNGTLVFSGSMASKSILRGTSVVNIKLDAISLIGDRSVEATQNYHGCGAAFIDCSGIRITGGGANTLPRQGYYFSGTSDAEVRDTEVHTVQTLGTSTQGSAGISVEDACSDIRILSNKIHDIGQPVASYQGMGIRVINYTPVATGPRSISITGNVITDVAEHGIVLYDENNAFYDEQTSISSNVITTTGVANTGRGLGIYCLNHVVGSIVNNTVTDTWSGGVTGTISRAAIAVAVEADEQPVEASGAVYANNGTAECGQGGLKILGVSGFFAQQVVQGFVSRPGVEINNSNNWTGDFVVVGDGTAVGVQVSDSYGTSTCSDFTLRAQVVGASSGVTLGDVEEGVIEVNVTGYTTAGAVLSDAVNCQIKVRGSSATDVPLFQTSGTNTGNFAEISGPNRAAQTAPYVRNNVPGTIITTWSDSAAPFGGTWAVGDKVNYRVPSAGSPDYARCVTAGSPGTWKAGASLAA